MSDFYTAADGKLYRKLHQEWKLLRHPETIPSDYEHYYVTIGSSAGTLILCNEVEIQDGDHRGFHTSIPVHKTELRAL